MQSYKTYIESANWRCEINILNVSMIHRYLIENGHKVINNPSEADYIIISSCGFTKNHEGTSTNIYKKHHSKKQKKASIFMYGCIVKINPELCESLDLTSVDFEEGEKFDKVFYNKVKFKDIKPYCDTNKLEKDFSNITDIQLSNSIPVILTKFLLPFSKKLKKNYERILNDLVTKDKILIEVCRGCASNCNYCVIKKTRGHIKSRPVKDIMKDIEKHYDKTRELFFVADDLTVYGYDIKTNLDALLHAINEKYPNILLNLDNLNPYWLEKYPEEFLSLFSKYNISYATIPVQSGSNKIIEDMNRNHDIKNTIDFVKKLKKISPQTATYTHFIVGYPKEGFMDYIKTLICSLFFDHTIVFVYSAPKEIDQSSLSYYKQIMRKTYRSVFFRFMLNFVLVYKLLTIKEFKKIS